MQRDPRERNAQQTTSKRALHLDVDILGMPRISTDTHTTCKETSKRDRPRMQRDLQKKTRNRRL